MKKLTLLFSSLGALAHFAKTYRNAAIVNTCNLTLTGYLSDDDVIVASSVYGASLIDTTDRVFSYEPLQVNRPPICPS